jgi:protein-disulfide isomerase
MKNLPLLIGTIVGTVSLIVVIAVMSSGGQTSDTSLQVTDTALLIGDAPHIYKSDLIVEETTPDSEESVIETNPNQVESTNSAESQTQENQELITIVEFSDFQCPACKAALPALQRVKSLYPGQVQLVYRHFPLDSIHPNARLAAVASEAVASLDETKFWLFHDMLFEKQQIWSTIASRNELKNTFASYAEELGIDKAQFLEKMEDKSMAELVNQDFAVATQLNVNSTPTFYVDGVKTSVTELLTAVESLISK